MVEKPKDYIWSSARFQVTDNKNGFLEPVWKDPVEREEYEKFLNISGEKEERFVPSKGWAEMIKKVYEIDPLTCPKCGGKMPACA